MLYKNLPDLNRQPYLAEPRSSSIPAAWHGQVSARKTTGPTPRTYIAQPTPLPRAARPTATHRASPIMRHTARAAAASAVRTSWQRQSAAAMTMAAPIRRRRLPLFAMFFVVVAGFVLVHSYVEPGKVTHAIAGLTTTQAEKDAAVKEVRLKNYKTIVDQIIAAHPDQNIAVSSIDLSDNSMTSLGDNGTFTGASTAKLITAIAILHQTELGTINLNDHLGGTTVRTLLQNMIVNSDNTAWLTLNMYLTHETLRDYMTTQGWTNYDPDVNTFIPADMARLMQHFYEGKLINSSNKQLLLGLMRQANKTEYIVSDVPSGYTVYHKAGWLDGLMHDVAIISNGNKTIVLTIYTYSGEADGDTPANQTTFKAITDAAMQAYFPAQSK